MGAILCVILILTLNTEKDREHKTGNSGEERQLSGHLQSPTVIDDGRLVSE